MSQTSVSAPSGRVDSALLLRALLLAAIGFAITFTAPLHEDVAFNRAIFVVLCAGLVVLGVVRLARSGRSTGASPAERFTLALSAVALLAGGATLATSGEASFSFILTVWAALGALLEVWHGLRSGQRDSLATGVLSGLLAIALTLGGGDTVAVIGFLGAYGIVAGVYLAISALDFSPAAGVTPARVTPLDTEIAGS